MTGTSTTTTPMPRIRAHMDSRVLFAWHCIDYLPNTVSVAATVDVSGRGRFETIIVTEMTFEMTMRTLADRCDALPGARRRAARKGMAA